MNLNVVGSLVPLPLATGINRDGRDGRAGPR